MDLLLPFLFVLIAYFMLIRPQQQRVRAQRALLASLRIGDEVTTAGGLFGTVVGLRDDRVSLRIAEGVVVDVLLPFITRRVSPAGGDPGDGIDIDLADGGPDKDL